MKKLVVILIVLLSGLFTDLQVYAQDEKSPELIVYYFHNTHRCKTCNAIEMKTTQTLDDFYKDEMEAGTIKMIVLNAEKKENKTLADKYEVYGATLLLVKGEGEAEQVENMTEFAFANVRTKPEKFIDGLKENINKLLQ